MSKEIQDFLLKHIDSVAQLEILCLLALDESKQWTSEEVNLELRSSLSHTTSQLNELAGKGFISQVQDESVNKYHFKPVNSELRKKIRRLLDEYSTRRVTVINLIYSQPLESIRDLADAFKLRKDD